MTESAPSSSFPPGHYYSPIPDIEELERRAGELFDLTARPIPGVDLNLPGQVALAQAFGAYRPGFLDGDGGRYRPDNGEFPVSDAFVLQAFLRHAQPKRVIEVGAGHSTCVMLDAFERHLSPAPRLTSIEPYPERLLSLVGERDRERFELVQSPVQDVDLELFDALGAGDVLFVDSSHVSKAGSDVNHLFFTVLPRLRPGVHVHFHDIMNPFEYPHDWIRGGRYWNEAYLLRAFLQYNDAFEVSFWGGYLLAVVNWKESEERPAWAEPYIHYFLDVPGSSIWIKRRG